MQHTNGNVSEVSTLIEPLHVETASDSVAAGAGKLEHLTLTPNEPIATAVREILIQLGETPEREGLARTPARVAQMWAELTAGYHVDPVALINGAIFTVDYDEMVLVKDIEFHSLCEHHLLPFIGRAHVAYVPCGTVIGLSKIPRIVDMFARRLQVQERMTVQIADFLETTIQPAGVAVAVTASHMCAAMRGVKQPNAQMVTSALRGVFRSDADLRAQFLSFRH